VFVTARHSQSVSVRRDTPSLNVIFYLFFRNGDTTASVNFEVKRKRAARELTTAVRSCDH